jgi:hypothetical protein
MFNNNQRKGLKAWVRYDGNNNAVAGSLIFQKDKPKVGKWKEYQDVNLCCPADCTVDYSPWSIVTGGEAGDGTVLVDDLEDQEFTFVGPNDSNDNGWVYLTCQFDVDTCLEINYQWTSFDEEPTLIHDRPVYWTSNTQPTGIPDDLTPRATTIPETGTWTITVLAGEWFAVGIYSDDSCCGRGFLSVSINENLGPCPTTTTTTTTI